MPSPVSFGMAAPQPAFCADALDDRPLALGSADGVGAEPALRPVPSSIPTRKATGSAPPHGPPRP